MRTMVFISLITLFAGCKDATGEKQLAEMRQENKLLHEQLTKTRAQLKQARDDLASAQRAKNDVEISQRLAKLQLEQARLTAQKLAEAQASGPEDGGMPAVDEAALGNGATAGDGAAPPPDEAVVRAAKKYYEEAYVIKSSNPERSRARLLQVMAMLPPDHIYYEKAAKLWKRLGSEAQPDDEKPADQTISGELPANELRKRGTEAYKKSEFPKAIAYYQHALEKNPKDFELHRLIGSVEARMGHRKKAYRAYQEYVRLCPKCMYAPTVHKILKDYEELNR